MGLKRHTDVELEKEWTEKMKDLGFRPSVASSMFSSWSRVPAVKGGGGGSGGGSGLNREDERACLRETHLAGLRERELVWKSLFVFVEVMGYFQNFHSLDPHHRKDEKS